MLVNAPRIQWGPTRPPDFNPDQGMVDGIEDDLYNNLKLLSVKPPYPQEGIRKILLRLAKRFRDILMDSEDARVCKQLEVFLEWAEAGGPIGKALIDLRKKVDAYVDQEGDSAIHTQGKLFVKPGLLNSPVDPPKSPLSPLSELTPSPPPQPNPPSPILPTPRTKPTSSKVTYSKIHRAKQTAQRSTGGKAPHKDMPSDLHPTDDLALPCRNPAVIPLRPRAVSLSAMAGSNLVSTASTRNLSQLAKYKHQWCMSCLNGGKQLNCTFCPRAVCFGCLPQLTDISPDLLEAAEFLCIRCHRHDQALRNTPYMVSFIYLFKSYC
jgi:hypothetical protein